jgi:hypothetical protein
VTFLEILQDLYEDHGYASSPASDVVTRFKKYVNQTVRDILTRPGMARLLDSDAPHTFASVASQARYVLPEAVAQVKYVTERSNDQRLRLLPLGEYRLLDPDPTASTGTPECWVPIGRVPVAVQPSDASEIFIKSTSASDTGTAYLEGIITGGYLRQVSVTMTGVTAVSLSAAITSFIEITDLYLSANAVGTVTLHEDSGAGTELARITIGQKRPRYTGIYLWPTPAAVVTYYVDYKREAVDLVNDTDEPPIPTDFHWVISAGARKRIYEKKDDSRYDAVAREYERGLKALRTHVLYPPDYDPGAPGTVANEGSNLGAWYPSGRW